MLFGNGYDRDVDHVHWWETAGYDRSRRRDDDEIVRTDAVLNFLQAGNGTAARHDAVRQSPGGDDEITTGRWADCSATATGRRPRRQRRPGVQRPGRLHMAPANAGLRVRRHRHGSVRLGTPCTGYAHADRGTTSPRRDHPGHWGQFVGAERVDGSTDPDDPAYSRASTRVGRNWTRGGQLAWYFELPVGPDNGGYASDVRQDERGRGLRRVVRCVLHHCGPGGRSTTASPGPPPSPRRWTMFANWMAGAVTAPGCRRPRRPCPLLRLWSGPKVAGSVDG